jgi:hypothetical protein
LAAGAFDPPASAIYKALARFARQGEVSSFLRTFLRQLPVYSWALARVATCPSEEPFNVGRVVSAWQGAVPNVTLPAGFGVHPSDGAEARNLSMPGPVVRLRRVGVAARSAALKGRL